MAHLLTYDLPEASLINDFACYKITFDFLALVVHMMRTRATVSVVFGQNFYYCAFRGMHKFSLSSAWIFDA